MLLKYISRSHKCSPWKCKNFPCFFFLLFLLYVYVIIMNDKHLFNFVFFYDKHTSQYKRFQRSTKRQRKNIGAVEYEYFTFVNLLDKLKSSFSSNEDHKTHSHVIVKVFNNNKKIITKINSFLSVAILQLIICKLQIKFL